MVLLFFLSLHQFIYSESGIFSRQILQGGCSSLVIHTHVSRYMMEELSYDGHGAGIQCLLKKLLSLPKLTITLHLKILLYSTPK